MPRRRLFAALLATSALALAATTAVGCASPTEEEEGQSGNQAQTVARPPQFVALAFDGSYNNAFWSESRAFAKANDLKFTYFINPSYYLRSENKSRYNAPNHGVGKSAIGWGGTSDEIKLRLENTAMAHSEGHEIASHAVGHWDGSSWSESDWDSEFNQFNDIFFNAARIAGIPAVNLGFDQNDIVGFRAPQLGHSPGLFRTLAKNSFTYDTSKSDAPNYWPKKVNGVWNMALARLKIVGTGKNTLSMDYNFYIADSRGTADPNTANHAVYEKQMLDTYMQYFQSNYYGNRAPVHIGHHFSKWNGGAYWKAMQTFAKRVCGLPEVKCVTYKEITAFEEQHASQIADYQAGNFQKMVRPPSAAGSEAVQPVDEELEGEGDGAHADEGAPTE